MAFPLENEYRVKPVESIEDRRRFTLTWNSTWLEEGYAEQTENIILKYSKYDLYSNDYILVDKKDHVVGTLRIISQNDTAGLPVLNDFYIKHHFDTNERLCEATLLTVNKSERSSDYICSYLLLIELWRYVRTHDINGIVIAADIRLWYLLTHKLGLCFKEIGQQKIYEGSLTVPGYLSVALQKELAMKITPTNVFEQALKEI